MSFADTETVSYYCYYCRNEKADYIAKYNQGLWSPISTKSYNQLKDNFTDFEKRYWSKIQGERSINPDAPVCRQCFENKDLSNEREVIKKTTPNLYKQLLDKHRMKELKELKEVTSSTEEIKLSEEDLENYFKDGWIGPVKRTCPNANCNYTSCIMKITSPRSLDEPPFTMTRCLACLEQHVDYKQ